MSQETADPIISHQADLDFQALQGLNLNPEIAKPLGALPFTRGDDYPNVEIAVMELPGGPNQKESASAVVQAADALSSDNNRPVVVVDLRSFGQSHGAFASSFDGKGIHYLAPGYETRYRATMGKKSSTPTDFYQEDVYKDVDEYIQQLPVTIATHFSNQEMKTRTDMQVKAVVNHSRVIILADEKAASEYAAHLKQRVQDKPENTHRINSDNICHSCGNAIYRGRAPVCPACATLVITLDQLDAELGAKSAPPQPDEREWVRGMGIHAMDGGFSMAGIDIPSRPELDSDPTTFATDRFAGIIQWDGNARQVLGKQSFTDYLDNIYDEANAGGMNPHSALEHAISELSKAMPGVNIVMSLISDGYGSIIGSTGTMMDSVIFSDHNMPHYHSKYSGKPNPAKVVYSIGGAVDKLPVTNIIMFSSSARNLIQAELDSQQFRNLFTNPAKGENISSPMHHLADVLKVAKLDQPTAIVGMSNSERLSVAPAIALEPSPTPELLTKHIEGWQMLFQTTEGPWESLGEARQAELEERFMETIRTYTALSSAPEAERPASDLMASAVNTLAAVAAFRPELAGKLAQRVVDGIELVLGNPTDADLNTAIVYVNDVTKQIAQDPTRAATLVSSNLQLSFARTMVILADRLKNVPAQDRITFAKNQLASPLYYIPGLLEGVI